MSILRKRYLNGWLRDNNLSEYSTTLEWLKVFRGAMSDPTHWTQYTSARDANGRPVSWAPYGAMQDNPAVCWCLSGWLGWHCAPSSVYQILYIAIKHESIPAFNDAKNRKHSAILKMLDHAIELQQLKDADDCAIINP